jgi:hypothetical protein
MTIEEIRKNAPEGATHYDRLGYYFHKTDDGYFVYSKLGNGWSTKPHQLTESEVALYGIKPL